MKGDFTRFTFQPNKQYTSVLMQQGRLQLDADWNEQMSILAYLDQTQIVDMIGATAGTPKHKEGFKIVATPDGSDLIIKPGSYYVGGLLCQLKEGTEVDAVLVNDSTLQVAFREIDGQAFKKDQWIEILPQGTLLKISKEPDSQTQILRLELDITERKLPTNQPGAAVKFRRITTYKSQPNNPAPSPIINTEDIDQYLIYLDVWQRHITAIEDPTIREPALAEIPDTTTRVKTVWQVRLDPISAQDKQNWEELLPKVCKGKLTVRHNTKNRAGINGAGLENQLYRVEIHKGGKNRSEVRYKWSRDNGIAVSAIKEIFAQESAIEITQPSRDPSRLFKAGEWVEVIDEVHELNQHPGTLVRLKDVVNQSGVKLLFNPSTVMGDQIDQEHFPKEYKPKVRRWDWKGGEPGLPLPSPNSDSGGWVELENGIEVNFDMKDAEFQTGDYWLIPTRMDDQNSIDWLHDEKGNPLPQKPFGIDHFYAVLAISKRPKDLDPKITFQPVAQYWDHNAEDGTGADQRKIFPPLTDCADLSELTPIVLGVGVKPPLARLHVAGPVAKSDPSILVSVSENSTSVSSVRGNQFQDKLHPGDVLTVGQESHIITVVEDNKLTLLEGFSATHPDAPLSYQQPVVRLDSGNKTQFILNALGDIGIGTIKPNAKLEVQASDRNATGLHVKDAKEKSLFVVQTDGKVGIGTDKPEHNLDIKGNLKASISETGFIKVQPQENQPVLFTTNNGFSFNQKITVSNGGVTVSKDGISVKGGATLDNSVTITEGINLTSGDLTIASGKLTLPQSGEISSPQDLLVNCSNKLTLRATTIDIDGDLQFNALNLERLQINQGLGIGVKAPTDGNLHAKGHLRLGTTETVTLEPPTKNNPVKLTTTDNTTGFEFNKGITIASGNLTLNSGSLNFGNTTPVPVSISISDSTLFFRAKNKNSMVIDNGNVGIGVDAPKQKLEVAGDAWIKGSTTLATLVGDNINVGIGIEKPNAKLHIQAANKQPEMLRLTDSDGQIRLSIQLEGNDGIILRGKNYVNVAPQLRANSVTVTSSRSLKENIATLSNQEAQEVLQSLNPVKFTYRADPAQTLHWGFIAEDVPELLASVDKQAISPVDIIAALTQLVKDHQDTIASLRHLLQEQGQALSSLEQKVQRLEENDW
jgi:hypothetical protein